MSKKRIFATVLSLVVGVSCVSVPTLRTQARSLSSSTSIAQNSDYQTGVNFKFKHVDTSAPLEGEYVGFTTFLQGKTRLVYALEEPTLVAANLPQTEFSEHLNKDKVYAILALAEKNTADTASAAAGLASQDYLTTLQYVAATQLAIYKVVAEGSKVYYVEDVGITPVGVNTVATWLKTQAEAAVTANADVDPIENVIIPNTTLTVEKDRAFEDTTTFVDYKFIGPFRVTSNKTQKLGITLADASVKLFTAIGGAEIQELKTNQDFYLRFEAETSYPGFKMDFNLQSEDFAVATFGNSQFKVVTSAWVPANLTTTLLLGDVNSYGTIKVSKFLDEVNTPLAMCKFEVRTEAGDLVAELITNESGVAFSGNLPAGTYKVKEVDNGQPYNVDATTYTVTLDQNGEVEEVVSYSTRSSGTVNITVTNKEGGNPVGYSKFQIIRQSDGALIREITMDETGVYNNIQLPPGNYYLKEVETNGSYQLNTEAKAFSITQEGQILTLDFEKMVTKSKIKFTVVRDTDKAPLSNVKIDVYKADGTWLTTLETPSSGIVEVGLPAGTYYGKLKAYSGYAVNANQTYAFTIYGNGETQVSDIQLSISMGDLDITVMDEQNLLVKNVEISIYDAYNQLIARQTSSESGKIVFSGLPSGQVLFYKISNVPYGYLYDEALVQFMLSANGETVFKEARVKRGTSSDGSGNGSGGTTDTPGGDSSTGGTTNTPSGGITNDTIGGSDSRNDVIYIDSTDKDRYWSYYYDSLDDVEIPATNVSGDVININGENTAIDINGGGTVIDIGGGTVVGGTSGPTVITGSSNVVSTPTVIPGVNSNNPTSLPATSDMDLYYYLVGGLCLAFSALSGLLLLKERRFAYEK